MPNDNETAMGPKGREGLPSTLRQPDGKGSPALSARSDVAPSPADPSAGGRGRPGRITAGVEAGLSDERVVSRPGRPELSDGREVVLRGLGPRSRSRTR